MMMPLTFQSWHHKNLAGTAATPATILLHVKEKRPRHLKSGTGTATQNAHFPLSSIKIFVSVGDGNIISGIHKGFKDLQALGWIELSPQIIGVQAEGSAAIANALQTGGDERLFLFMQKPSLTASRWICRVMVFAQSRRSSETGGRYIIVSDQEILFGYLRVGKIRNFCRTSRSSCASRSRIKALQQKTDPT